MKRKLFNALVGIVSLSIFIGIIATSCNRETEEIELSDHISQVTKGNNSYLVNTETGETVVKNIQMDWVHPGNDSIAVFSKDNKRGYINTRTGEIIVPPTYKHAWIFSEGLAGVVKDDKVGFINTKGEVVIECQFPYRGNSLSEFIFRHGHCIVADSTQKLGVINPKGEWLVKPEYDEISLAADYAIVGKDGDFNKQIAYDGTILMDCVIDYVNDIYFRDRYIDATTGRPEVARVSNPNYFEYRVCGRCGLMNDKGEFITRPIYRGIDGVSPTVFRATLQDGYSEILINEKGEILSRVRN